MRLLPSGNQDQRLARWNSTVCWLVVVAAIPFTSLEQVGKDWWYVVTDVASASEANQGVGLRS
jgi:hypothetical protein